MDGKYRSEKNVKKFTKKTKGLLENELERLIEEGLLPKEAKAEVSEKKIMAYIYIQQPYTTSEITLLASLDVSDAFDAMNKLDCSVKEITKPWINALLRDAQKEYVKIEEQKIDFENALNQLNEEEEYENE